MPLLRLVKDGVDKINVISHAYCFSGSWVLVFFGFFFYPLFYIQFVCFTRTTFLMGFYFLYILLDNEMYAASLATEVYCVLKCGEGMGTYCKHVKWSTKTCGAPVVVAKGFP